VSFFSESLGGLISIRTYGEQNAFMIVGVLFAEGLILK